MMYSNITLNLFLVVDEDHCKQNFIFSKNVAMNSSKGCAAFKRLLPVQMKLTILLIEIKNGYDQCRKHAENKTPNNDYLRISWNYRDKVLTMMKPSTPLSNVRLHTLLTKLATLRKIHYILAFFQTPHKKWWFWFSLAIIWYWYYVCKIHLRPFDIDTSLPTYFPVDSLNHILPSNHTSHHTLSSAIPNISRYTIASCRSIGNVFSKNVFCVHLDSFFKNYHSQTHCTSKLPTLTILWWFRYFSLAGTTTSPNLVMLTKIHFPEINCNMLIDEHPVLMVDSDIL